MTDAVEFFVDGVPVSQGSKNVYTNRRTGRPILVESSKALPEWRRLVTGHAYRAVRNRPGVWEPFDGPVRVALTFYLPRPTSVKVSKRPFPIVKPDLDKLERAVWDALTNAGVWVDDARAVESWKAKRYADEWPAGVRVLVGPLEVV